MERNCEPMNKNRIEGVAEQGERARFGEALVIKASSVDPVNPCFWTADEGNAYPVEAKKVVSASLVGCRG